MVKQAKGSNMNVLFSVIVLVLSKQNRVIHINITSHCHYSFFPPFVHSKPSSLPPFSSPSTACRVLSLKEKNIRKKRELGRHRFSVGSKHMNRLRCHHRQQRVAVGGEKRLWDQGKRRGLLPVSSLEWVAPRWH